jgi:sodium/bile acid cotransporter 7
MDWLKRHWFLVGLVVLIPGGLLWGMTLSEADLEAIERATGPNATTYVVAIVLFLMAFSLDSRQLAKSLRSPGPVVWGCVVNAVVTPLLAWGLMRLQLLSDFSVGLMIAATVPCTLAAASVWTRKAGGNDAVALLVTLTTNGLCFLITPLWLNFVLSSDVQFDVVEMMQKLLYTALIPTALGQGLRLMPLWERFAAAHKPVIGAVAQCCVLTVVFAAAFLQAGPQVSRLGVALSGPAAVAVVWASAIVIHVVAMGVAWYGGELLGLVETDRIAVTFAGSQKTLPIGLLVATHPEMFGDGSVPFAVFPMLMYHASQLFIDTWVADWMLLRQSVPHAEAALPRECTRP